MSPAAAPADSPTEAAPPAAPLTTPLGTLKTEPFVFTPPRRKAVLDHAAALKASPDDATLACWPKDLAKTVAAGVALEKGDRPLLVVFYDDTARASRLWAADLWPVVLDVEARVDLVLVDLTPGKKFTPDEKALVRRYYLGYVPTTVVLSSERAIRFLKSERVDPAVVKAAADESK